MQKIAAVVVTYNRKDLLLENIAALLNQTVKEELDVIIIDNASTDGTKEALSNYIDNERIIYVNTGENLGGAGGFQRGIKCAVDNDNNYDYIWIMDDDCIPRENSLEKLLESAKDLDYNFGFLSSKVLWKNDELCKMNIQKKSVWQKNDDWKAKRVNVIMASFVSLLVPTNVVKEVGLPIKEFFIWTDDWEYTRRISICKPCYLVNESVVVHKSKSNNGADISNDTRERLNRYKYLYRNDVYLYRREGFNGVLYEIVRLSYHIVKVLFSATDNRFLRFGAIMSGTIKGLRFHPQIESI